MHFFRSNRIAQKQLRDSLTILTWLLMRAETLRLENSDMFARQLDLEAYMWAQEPILRKHLRRLDLDQLRAECRTKAKEARYQTSRP